METIDGNCDHSTQNLMVGAFLCPIQLRKPSSSSALRASFISCSNTYPPSSSPFSECEFKNSSRLWYLIPDFEILSENWFCMGKRISYLKKQV